MIEVKDLWKSFGDNHVLKGITLEVPKGTTRAVVASSIAVLLADYAATVIFVGA